jgi:hypothetical protein
MNTPRNKRRTISSICGKQEESFARLLAKKKTALEVAEKHIETRIRQAQAQKLCWAP